MGYSTDFEGELKFKNELTREQLANINEIIEDDEGSDNYIDLEITKDMTGLKWNGAEKTRGMVESVNAIIEKMIHCFDCDDFGLTGGLEAQGEEMDDRWRLIMKDGVASRVEFPRIGQKITCPHCDRDFRLED